MRDNDYTGYIPTSFAATTLDMLNPNRSVIVDMIMVQLISVIVTMSMILIFKGGQWVQPVFHTISLVCSPVVSCSLVFIPVSLADGHLCIGHCELSSAVFDLVKQPHRLHFVPPCGQVLQIRSLSVTKFGGAYSPFTTSLAA